MVGKSVDSDISLLAAVKDGGGEAYVEYLALEKYGIDPPFYVQGDWLKPNTLVHVIRSSVTQGTYTFQSLNSEGKLFSFTKYLNDFGHHDGNLIRVRPITKTKILTLQEQLLIAHRENPCITRGYASTGTDPECFALDAKGVVIPAWKYLGKKKETTLGNPYSDPNQVFYDGFQAELVTPAASCHDSLNYYIQSGLIKILKAAQKFNPKASLSSKDVVDVPFEMMKACTDEQAELGCSPSLSIYPDIQPIQVEDPKALPFRFAGCHYHAGIRWQEKDDEKALTIRRIVSLLDQIVGPVMTCVLQGLEDPRRRQFYGRPGEYRLPLHGLEYRTASSRVLCNPTVSYLFFDLARTVVEMGRQGQGSLWNCEEVEARDVIMNCDVKGAKKILQRNKKVFTALKKAVWSSLEQKVAVDALIDLGAKELLEVHNMDRVWMLTTADTSFEGKYRLQYVGSEEGIIGQALEARKKKGRRGTDIVLGATGA